MDTKNQVIKVFKRAIHLAQKEDKPTRITNLFGHLARYKELREWFLKCYPIATEHIMFIHENPKHFSYDLETGSISINLSGARGLSSGASGGHEQQASGPAFKSAYAVNVQGSRPCIRRRK